MKAFTDYLDSIPWGPEGLAMLIILAVAMVLAWDDERTRRKPTPYWQKKNKEDSERAKRI